MKISLTLNKSICISENIINNRILFAIKEIDLRITFFKINSKLKFYNKELI